MKATFHHPNYPPKKLSKKKNVSLSKNLEKKYFKSILNYTKRKLLMRICSLYINVRNRKKVNTFSYSLIEHSVFIIYMIYVYI